ncbi:1,6-anhydro-N-acetylmuramyl-L-alanine amidase AmpD [Methyloterricola oryzae]|uniref:1,6-anhydro-N-acetylmuramyl-L-alanine amidase AmpD n=1 Tax=Methyloterricola oryzae TaxID=1495050 RepID=UPI0005EBC098|nr:1,6-anhydro-N-acetylmuramyl-L-alanine amidase AmpD [Methyloterricola oryzae]
MPEPMIQAGWLEGVRHIPSPNHDERPDPEDVSLIVVHGISLPPGEFGGDGVERLFTNTLPEGVHPYYDTIRNLRVAAHAFIRRDGEVIQFVPFHRRAWHAGVSEYRGRSVCNDFSIGIELEGTDTLPYTEDQYGQLASLIRALCAHYPSLSTERIAGHSEIAPGRKTDPGPCFEWPRLHGLLGS